MYVCSIYNIIQEIYWSIGHLLVHWTFIDSLDIFWYIGHLLIHWTFFDSLDIYWSIGQLIHWTSLTSKVKLHSLMMTAPSDGRAPKTVCTSCLPFKVTKYHPFMIRSWLHRLHNTFISGLFFDICGCPEKGWVKNYNWTSLRSKKTDISINPDKYHTFTVRPLTSPNPNIHW